MHNVFQFKKKSLIKNNDNIIRRIGKIIMELHSEFATNRYVIKEGKIHHVK